MPCEEIAQLCLFNGTIICFAVCKTNPFRMKDDCVIKLLNNLYNCDRYLLDVIGRRNRSKNFRKVENNIQYVFFGQMAQLQGDSTCKSKSERRNNTFSFDASFSKTWRNRPNLT